MTLADDETLAEEAHGSPVKTAPMTVPLESGMDTGQGADDEPELAIGDRHIGDAERLSPDEAKRLLGGKDG